MGLSALDYTVTAGSLLVVFAVAIVSTLYKNKATGAYGFFLAGRNMPWFICAASLFASNVGTEHFVGQAGGAASGGIAIGLYEWTAAYQLLMMGWIFAPVYLRCQLTTVPEFLEGRYNKYCRFVFVLITMMAYVTTKISASLYAGALVLEVVAGIKIWTAVPVVVLATAVYTMAGGLTAVMLTDSIQMVIFLVGGIFGSIKSLQLVGGIGGLFDIFRERDLDYMTHMIHAPDDRDYPWPGMFFGLSIASVWYWCIDQEMAQRVLSARNLDHAKICTTTAGFLKIIPVFITVFPGMVARALFELCKTDELAGKEERAFPEWCDSDLDTGNSGDKAYPWLVLRHFPSGLRGLMMASFLAAMMSSLSSVYNSASTVFTYDIYQRFWYPEGNAPQQRLINVGRITVGVLTVLTFLWLPMIAGSQMGLFLFLQNASMHMAGPIVAIFLMAIFWKRANGPGALAGFVSGAVVGLIRLVISVLSEDMCNQSKYIKETSEGIKQVFTASNFIQCIGFLYISIFLFVFTAVITAIVSLLTPPPRPEQLKGRMFEDWGFWKKICSCLGGQNSKEGNEYTALVAPQEDSPAAASDQEKQPILSNAPSKNGGEIHKYYKIAADISGVGVLIAITVLIVVFR
ncbi:hypothetical protein BSKO_09424 [Bryopsis sp. KO-2023]|nr:hypothetical protein BSKO_09424 [Bryopsis sp. KO-2023]